MLLIAFLALHTVAAYYYIAQQNITFDEPQYIEYAKRWLHGHPDRIYPLDDSKSPVVAVCWLPRIVRQLINPTYKLTDYGRKDQAEGRYMMILFSFLAALYVYKWCRDLYGVKGWWLPVLLMLFDPLYMSYSVLITTDLACGAVLVALLYHFRKYLLSGSRKQFYIAALYAGLAIVTKQTMIFILLLLPILAIVYLVSCKKTQLIFSKKSFTDGVLFCLVILLVINISYYFYHSFTPLGRYEFESITFRKLQASISFLHWLPVPLPLPYVQSLDMIKAHAEYGPGRPDSTFNAVYLFGNFNFEGGYWYYYIVTFFYKMPLGTLLLLCTAAVLFIKKIRSQSFYKSYVFLLVPIVFYGIILSFFNHFQTGIRHLLIVFPLMYIGLGKLFYEVAQMKTAYKFSFAGIVGFVFFTVIRYYPYLIPYTNEFVSNKKKVYKIMADSSVDYGQSDSAVNKYIALHPGCMKAAETPAAGRFAIPMSRIVTTTLWKQNPYKWYQKIEPVGLYQHVILLYDIQEKDLELAGLK